MPAQRTFFGQAMTFPGRLPRRVIFLLGFILFLTISTLLVFSPSSGPSLEQVKHISETIPYHLPDHIPKVPKLTLPAFHNPFWHPTHKPPVQANSTSGEAKWFSDWKWLNPFSSSITLEENRSVLPPLRIRPPVYTFYDTSVEKDDATRDAENELLLVWRRAWWAQGFRPLVLGRSEAMHNPLYESLQTQQLDPVIESDLSRWLAWEHMGAGILVNWLAVPMGPYEDPLLSYMRRGDYPTLTRYEGLGNGLFSGSGVSATAALKKVMSNKELNKTKTLLEAFPRNTFQVDPSHDGIAFYDDTIITNRYKAVFEKLTSSRPTGLHALAQLINSHLHMTFQNAFSKGIAVLNPIAKHSTILTEPAMQIATYLAECTGSPIPSSCPPNRPKCKPCVSAHPLHISRPSVFQNTSTLYTIGTIPHPYTLATLASQRDNIDVAYIRRQTSRNPWLLAATKELLGTGVGTSPRLLKFKEAVASEWGVAHSLWLIPEKDLRTELDWHFGFAIPKNITDKGFARPPVPGSKPNTPPPKTKLAMPSEQELQLERSLLEKAKDAVRSSIRPQQSIREAVEAWNLADAEAWRFTRAFGARSKVERLKWEEEETKLGASAGSGGGGTAGWSRWLDGFRS